MFGKGASKKEPEQPVTSRAARAECYAVRRMMRKMRRQSYIEWGCVGVATLEPHAALRRGVRRALRRCCCAALLNCVSLPLLFSPSRPPARVATPQTHKKGARRVLPLRARVRPAPRARRGGAAEVRAAARRV